MKILNIKSLFAVIVMATMGMSASAQNGNYVLNNFWDNWYIAAGAGVQSYVGTSPGLKNSPKFMKRATVTYNAELGKWITPSFGVRGQFIYTPAATMYYPGVSMRMFNFHADAMLNLTNVFGGYKMDRFYQPVIFAGAGYGNNKMSYKGAETDQTVTFNAGLINKFRISNSFDINLELAAMFLPKNTDGYVGESNKRIADVSVAATAGITYRFGGDKEFVRNVPAVEVDLTPYNNKIKELENAVSAANAKAAELLKKLQELQNRPVQKEAAKVSIPSLSTFYNIGSSKLGARELVNLEAIANYIKSTPDTNYKLSGLIDYSCGSRQLNDNLCKARVDAMYKELVRLGVKESQLTKSTEAPTSPHKNPILNRGVVITVK